MKSKTPKKTPLAYLITLTYYGTHLHGSLAGSVNRKRNQFGSDLEPANLAYRRHTRRRMLSDPYVMDCQRRDIGLRTMREVCRHRTWNLISAHVRSTHLHAVVQAEVQPSKIAGDVKSYVSRALNVSGVDLPGRRRWTEGKSVRYLWELENVRAAAIYVVQGQGSPMSVYPDPSTDIEKWVLEKLKPAPKSSEP